MKQIVLKRPAKKAIPGIQETNIPLPPRLKQERINKS